MHNVAAYLRHNSRIFAALIILGGALTKIGVRIACFCAD